MDGLLGTFSGTLVGTGYTGRIEIDGEFPKSSPGEWAEARTHIEDFPDQCIAFQGGAKVTFELWRINGDLIAKKISKA